jgi:hypothetical protein
MVFVLHDVLYLYFSLRRSKSLVIIIPVVFFNFLEYQQNPYKPTYTFPEEFDGDSDHMEDYIRKTASQTNDKDNRKREIENK